jgi:D-psicose/D-tagatose/L-ribulose 3-epimerase
MEGNMRVGINLLLWTATPNFAQHEAILEKIKDIGFDAFETSVGGMDATEVSKFAKKADQLGLSRTALDVYVASDMDVISSEPAMRKKAVDFLKACISKTRDLGAEVFSGPMYQGLCNTTQTGPSKDEMKWALDGLRECAQVAKEKGIRLAAEPINRFEMYLLNSMEQAYAFAKETGFDNFGILADTHHSNIEEYDVVASWSKVLDRIYNIHISENNRGIPGMGHAIPPALFDMLKKGGYKGHLIIEAFNANVPETLPLLRLWRPFVQDTDEIAVKGLAFIRKYA